MKNRLRSIFSPLIDSLLVFTIIGCVAYVLWDVPPQPIQGFTVQHLAQAVAQHDILTIQYQSKSQELVGRVRREKKHQYGGDEFRLTETLPLKTYQQIIEQKLSSSPFLGPVQDLDQNKEFETALRLKPATLSNPYFKTGEQAVYNIESLGMSLGQLTLEVLPPILLSGEPSYRVQMKARTSGSIARMYRANDVAETFLRAHDFAPLAFSLRLDESERFGGLFELQTLKGGVTRWTSLATKARGLQMTKNQDFRDPGAQNMASLIYALRAHDWQKPFGAVLYDQDKRIELSAHSTGTQTLKTILGSVEAHVVEPRIQLEGKAQPQIKVWLQKHAPHALLRIEADIKIGKVRADLAQYVAP